MQIFLHPKPETKHWSSDQSSDQDWEGDDPQPSHVLTSPKHEKKFSELHPTPPNSSVQGHSDKDIQIYIHRTFWGHAGSLSMSQWAEAPTSSALKVVASLWPLLTPFLWPIEAFLYLLAFPLGLWSPGPGSSWGLAFAGTIHRCHSEQQGKPLHMKPGVDWVAHSRAIWEGRKHHAGV